MVEKIYPAKGVICILPHILTYIAWISNMVCTSIQLRCV
jgi:hypothetical protein